MKFKLTREDGKELIVDSKILLKVAIKSMLFELHSKKLTIEVID